MWTMFSILTPACWTSHSKIISMELIPTLSKGKLLLPFRKNFPIDNGTLIWGSHNETWKNFVLQSWRVASRSKESSPKSWGKKRLLIDCIMPPCTKRGPNRNVLSSLVWKNLTGLHRSLTYYLTTITHIWDQLYCNLQTRSNYPTSVPNLPNAVVAYGHTFPQTHSKLLWTVFPEVAAVIATHR